MRLKRRHEAGAVIPTASMADIAFLLIVFFTVTITCGQDKTQVALPKAELRFEATKKAAVVSVTDNGQIRVSTGEEMSAPVAPDDVVTFAANLVIQFPGREVVIKADDKVPYRNIDKVIDSLKQAKVENIYLLSDQRTVDDDSGG